ncbi:MAG: phage holin family protein [Leptolyngbyaceae cyanobacterium SL_7_1]|nr:phage holin family protein [Leptolyngbyaceae cyanobacterium SL_7_1]
MLGFFLTTLITALGLLVTDIVVPGVNIASFPAAMIAALAIGLVNGSIRPVLSTLSLPINFLTLGAFSLVVNGICFWLASILAPGFAVTGVPAFILGPIVLSFASTLLNRYFADRPIGRSLSGADGKVALDADGGATIDKVS